MARLWTFFCSRKWARSSYGCILQSKPINGRVWNRTKREKIFKAKPFLWNVVRCHLPLLYVGVEYGLTNNVKLAEKFFSQALDIAPKDPFVLHEMGVACFQNQEYVFIELQATIASNCRFSFLVFQLQRSISCLLKSLWNSTMPPQAL